MGELLEVNVEESGRETIADDMKNGNKTGVQNYAGEGQKSGNLYLYLTILAGVACIAAVVWFPTTQILKQLKEVVDILEKPQFRKFVMSAENGGTDARLPEDCYDIQRMDQTKSGVYKVYPGSVKRGIKVFCDMTTDGGGWLVIQRRQDGKTDFSRDWYQYQVGFGDIENEYWLGNEYIHKITSQGWYELRVDMMDFNGKSRYAKYMIFKVDNNENRYRLTVDGYSGDAGDSLGIHNKMMFSTVDSDNDYAPGNCAISFKGGFWYNNCHSANPNGFYFKGGKHESLADGINWHSWRGYKYSMKTIDMKIRPV